MQATRITGSVDPSNRLFREKEETKASENPVSSRIFVSQHYINMCLYMCLLIYIYEFLHSQATNKLYLCLRGFILGFEIFLWLITELIL